VTADYGLPLPTLPDRFGVVWPDGSVSDVTESARLFDQDPENRARLIASKIQGRPVRIVTELASLLPIDGSDA
jgi:hypothetical protein